MRDTILVCGSRGWDDGPTMTRWLDVALRVPGVNRVVHGGAKGADVYAGAIATDVFNAYVDHYPVDIAIDGPWPGAGPRRNARMLDAELDRIRRVLAFSTPVDGPLGITRGPADMVSRCLRAGLAVTIVVPGARP